MTTATDEQIESPMWVRYAWAMYWNQYWHDVYRGTGPIKGTLDIKGRGLFPCVSAEKRKLIAVGNEALKGRRWAR